MPTKGRAKKSAKAKKPVAKKKLVVKAKKTAKAPMKMKAKAPVKKVKPVVKAKPAKPVDLKLQIEALENKILAEKKNLVDLRRKLRPEEVNDYVFRGHDGAEVKLSEMFGGHDELILVHNMGKACPYCTMWADGFVGLTKHLNDRLAFVVVSKDEVETQREFYQSRDWNFAMYSSHDCTFNKDLGFESDEGGQYPGVSAFHKDEMGKIYRTGYTYFGPGDDFCAVWPMLDLLPGGAKGWEPKFAY